MYSIIPIVASTYIVVILVSYNNNRVLLKLIIYEFQKQTRHETLLYYK